MRPPSPTAVMWMAASLLAALPAGAAPPAFHYTVQRGDTLYTLARAYFVHPADYRTVRKRNHVANPRRLRVGMELEIPTELLRARPISAHLLGFRGEVTIGPDSKPVAAFRDMSFGEGVTIATGPDSYAEFELPDGSRISVPSQSRLRVERLRLTLMTGALERALVVEKGRSESHVTPLKSPWDSYKVSTPLSVSAVRGTEFRVQYDEDRRQASTEVVKGVVQVSAGHGEPVVVDAGYGTNIGAGGVAAPETLLPAPSLLRPDRPLDDASIQIDITPTPGAVAYQGVLATDAGFVDTLAETTSTEPRLAFGRLPDGVYFLRLTAVATDGLEGLPATYALDRTLNTLSLAAPIQSIAGRHRRYQFRWQAEGEGQRSYRFQLYRDQNARPIIDEAGLTERELTVTDLRPGIYTWRIMSRTVTPGRQVEKWSAPQAFHVGV
jgi:hypothetical protein